MTRVICQALLMVISLIAFGWATMGTMRKLSAPPVAGHDSEGVESAPVAAVLPTVPALKGKTFADFPQTLAHPLFFEGRAFPTAQHQAVVVERSSTGDETRSTTAQGLRLIGVRIFARSRKALISVSNNEARWYAENDAVDVWVIHKIEPQAVILARGGERATVNLYEHGAND